jgi:hypothetical protein
MHAREENAPENEGYKGKSTLTDINFDNSVRC